MTKLALERVAMIFRALGEVNRLKLIIATEKGGSSVSQLMATTGLSQANVSKHLKVLADSGILIRCRQGKYVIYSTTNSAVLMMCEKVSKASCK